MSFPGQVVVLYIGVELHPTPKYKSTTYYVNTNVQDNHLRRNITIIVVYRCLWQDHNYGFKISTVDTYILHSGYY